MERRFKYIFTLSFALLLVLAGCGSAAKTASSTDQAVQQTVPSQTTTASPQPSTALADGVLQLLQQRLAGTSRSTSPATTGAANVAAIEQTLEQMYRRVSPSVVHIAVSQKVQSAVGGLPFGFQFFGQPAPLQQAPQYQQGLGSGFVWDTQGHIVTNNHVVDGADTISVTFSDGTTLGAKLVATDPNSDLAVIKVDMPAARLQPVTMGDSTTLNVGQLAVAIGNPFGLDNTMTVGFISALGRSLPVQADDQQGQQASYIIPDIIQTDAPINPGNSGGVLLDDAGQVIGVTAAIESPTHTSAGIGFAVPAAEVQKVVPALIASGHYDHPWLGLLGTTLAPDAATAMNLPATQRGALVIEVMADSPAAKAGLKGSDQKTTINGLQTPIGGDVITAIDGQPVTRFDDVITYLERSKNVGDMVAFTIIRDGKQQTVQVTLAARPAR